jgi:hypothetical protein
MKKTKFIVKVNRGGTRATEYVQRMDRAPIRMTTDRKLVSRCTKFGSSALSVQAGRLDTTQVVVPQ